MSVVACQIKIREQRREIESAKKHGIMHDTITTVLGTFEMRKTLEIESKSKRMM